jgi:MFS family permease
MWMNDVAAAWTMTSLTSSATLIALVQTASSLPVLLLGVPSGALADIINRKHYFVFAQIWLAINATALTLILMLGALNPYLLLFLTFTNGIGLAMRWPIFAAIVPEIVPREWTPHRRRHYCGSRQQICICLKYDSFASLNGHSAALEIPKLC